MIDDVARQHTLDDAKIAYRNGRYDEAGILFQKFADQNNAEALFFLGNMIADGLGLPINIDSAKNLLKRSADLGYLPASYRLRQLENKDVKFTWNSGSLTLQEQPKDATDDNEPATPTLTLKTEKKDNNQDYKRQNDTDKVALCKQLALQGELEAMFEYGLLLTHAKEPDYTNGAFWLGRAAQKGHALAQYRLSRFYFKGLGVSCDRLQGLLWLKRSAEQGVLDAIYDIAMIYCDPNGGSFNPQEGIRLLQNIKEQKPKVLVKLAVLLQKGEIIPQNLALAKEYLIHAKNLGVLDAVVELGNLYISEGDYVDGVPLLKEAANKNNIEAIYRLALLYEKGQGVAQLEDKAAFLFDKAAEMGHRDAQYHFGCICRKLHTPEGDSLARSWFAKSAILGNIDAKYEYGRILKEDVDQLANSDSSKDNEREHYVSWSINKHVSPYFSQYKEAFTLLLDAAQGGNIDAQFLVSTMYHHGLGVQNDDVQASYWCKMSAESGNFDAQFRMAQMYDKGEIFRANLDQAVEWYTSASDNGSAEATFCLAQMYKDGRGVSQNDCHAFKLLCKASQMGYVDATYQLAQCYLYGIGVQPNRSQAEECFRIAAKSGLEEATLELVRLYVSSNDLDPKQVQFAVVLLNKEVEKGHGSSTYFLANMYLYGRGCEKDEQKGVQLLIKAAQLNDRNALYDLGKLYFAGNVVPRDYRAAVKNFSSAAELGFDAAQYMMGVCSRDGLGTLIDYSKARYYFTEAAQRGYSEAYLALGRMYEHGTGGICNLQEAINYYRLLASCNYDEAYVFIANIYLHNSSLGSINYENAAMWLARGAANHHSQSCYMLAMLHLNNKLIKSDFDKGLELLREAVNNGFSDALYELAKMYIEGKCLAHNYAKAISYLQKASTLNHVEATTLLGQMYIRGQGCERSPLIASDLFTSAANHGDPIAQFELAKLFKDGIGVPKSSFDAYIWSVLALSCADGFTEAQKLRDEVMLSLTNAQLIQAQSIAADYFNRFAYAQNYV